MWGWPFIFSRLPASAVLVCDNEILVELNAISSGLKCQTRSPDTLGKPLAATTQIVVVFVQNNELALTRDLRRQYPNKTILSAAHDLAPNAGASTDKPALPDYSSLPKDDPNIQGTRPTLVLATPGADSPYLAGILRDNNLADPVEHVGRPIVDLVQWHDGFSSAAFTANLRQLYTHKTELCVLMRTDVCIALIENAGLTVTSFLRYVRTAGFRVICLNREDRITQCAQGQLFRHRKIRSVWDISAGQGKKFAEKAELAVAGSVNYLSDIVRGERLINAISSSNIPSLAFSLEHLLANPKTTLENVCSLLEKPAIDNPIINAYTPPAKNVPIVGRLAAKLKRELIDRTGIHVSHSDP